MKDQEIQNKTEAEAFYRLHATQNNGKELSFDSLRGKVVLIVNTASKCGLTPQFKELEELYQQYKAQGLVVIGFPCNQFANQDPQSDEEIQSFCSLNYGVSFQMMRKIMVNGSDAHPVFKYLKSRASGWFTSAIKWNFTKFLISKDAQEIKRFAPITSPHKLRNTIEQLLQE